MNAIPIRWIFHRIEPNNHYPDTCKQGLSYDLHSLLTLKNYNTDRRKEGGEGDEVTKTANERPPEQDDCH